MTLDLRAAYLSGEADGTLAQDHRNDRPALPSLDFPLSMARLTAEPGTT
jgi:hypothetical protein